MFGCPYLRADGGDCGLVHADADPVYVKLSGVCAGGQFGPIIINGIRQRLNEAVARSRHSGQLRIAHETCLPRQQRNHTGRS
ncbi:NifU family protein [Mesorhizobium sp. M0902]|uniref:NifU family protein n=1 Tax=Mesorhizobium sp. M0902 TaxID=2957021 RepID=UPI00333B3C77